MKRREKGQVLVEYALILVLITIVVIAVLAKSGDSFGEVVEGIVCVLTGDCAATTSVGESDSLVGEADIIAGTRQTTPELGDLIEKILILGEEAEAQEEGLQEGSNLDIEAVVEGLEVLVDKADDIDKQALSESLSQLAQDIKDGNLDAVLDAATWLGTELAEVPLEVWTALSLKMAPRLINSCEAVSGGSVSHEAIAAVQEALDQLDPGYAGKVEALQSFQEGVDMIEERESFGKDLQEINAYALDAFIAGLQAAGEFELADQLANDSEACGY